MMVVLGVCQLGMRCRYVKYQYHEWNSQAARTERKRAQMARRIDMRAMISGRDELGLGIWLVIEGRS